MNRNLLEKGFIPQEICTHLPNGFEDVEEISSSLHKILANNQISNVVNEIDQEKDNGGRFRRKREPSNLALQQHNLRIRDTTGVQSKLALPPIRRALSHDA